MGADRRARLYVHRLSLGLRLFQRTRIFKRPAQRMYPRQPRKGKSGLCILSSAKKRGFLADPKYLKYKGFIKADSAEPYFELMYLPFDPSAPAPRFREQVKSAQTDGSGFEIFYTSQCPFTAKYVPLIENMANDMNLPLSAVHISSREQAQNAPCAYTAFSLFYNGKFITHEIPSEKKFAAICEEFVK